MVYARKYPTISWVLLLITLAVVPTEAWAGIVVPNPSFETSGTGGQPFASWSASSTTYVLSKTSWTTPGTTRIWNPADGSKFALLDATANKPDVTLTSISFNVPTAMPLTFKYFYDVSYFGSKTPAIVEARLSTDGTNWTNVVWSNNSVSAPSSTSGQWLTALASANLSAGTNYLRFELRDTGNLNQGAHAYFGVDNVVPVPAAFLLSFLGLGTAGLKLRRFA